MFRALARMTLAGNLWDGSIYAAEKWKRGALRLTWHLLRYWWQHDFLKYSEKHENTGVLLMHADIYRRLTLEDRKRKTHTQICQCHGNTDRTQKPSSRNTLFSEMTNRFSAETAISGSWQGPPRPWPKHDQLVRLQKKALRWVITNASQGELKTSGSRCQLQKHLREEGVQADNSFKQWVVVVKNQRNKMHTSRNGETV